MLSRKKLCSDRIYGIRIIESGYSDSSMKPEYLHFMIGTIPRNRILFRRHLIPTATIAIKPVKRRIIQQDTTVCTDRFINFVIMHGIPQRTRSANQNFILTVEIDILEYKRPPIILTLQCTVIETQCSFGLSDSRIEDIFPCFIIPPGNWTFITIMFTKNIVSTTGRFVVKRQTARPFKSVSQSPLKGG